jgi:transglutaminase-like putative cysteine protease
MNETRSAAAEMCSSHITRLVERQMPDPDRKVDAWARRVVFDANSKQTVLEAMTHPIKEEFRYSARHEEGTQTAAQTLALSSGTCRDFAVLMMEALRSFGLATRFVTGYLYGDSSGTTRGGGTPGAASICLVQVGSNTTRRTVWSPGRT